MRLFRLELKRILKSRRTLILLAIALLLSVAMAYLPISFEGINRPNEDGTVTELDGLAAIKYKQDLYKTSAGEVTPDRIKSALETYQSCVREYGPVEEEGFPLAVFIEKIVPFRHLLMGLSEAFADPVTGIGADLMDIDPNDIDGAYYEKCAEHLQDAYGSIKMLPSMIWVAKNLYFFNCLLDGAHTTHFHAPMKRRL